MGQIAYCTKSLTLVGIKMTSAMLGDKTELVRHHKKFDRYFMRVRSKQESNAKPMCSETTPKLTVPMEG